MLPQFSSHQTLLGFCLPDLYIISFIPGMLNKFPSWHGELGILSL